MESQKRSRRDRRENSRSTSRSNPCVIMRHVPGWRKRRAHGRASWGTGSLPFQQDISSQRSPVRLEQMMISSLCIVHVVCRSNWKTEDVAGRRRLIYRVGVGKTNRPTWRPSFLVCVFSFPHSSLRFDSSGIILACAPLSSPPPPPPHLACPPPRDERPWSLCSPLLGFRRTLTERGRERERKRGSSKKQKPPWNVMARFFNDRVVMFMEMGLTGERGGGSMVSGFFFSFLLLPLLFPLLCRFCFWLFRKELARGGLLETNDRRVSDEI